METNEKKSASGKTEQTLKTTTTTDNTSKKSKKQVKDDTKDIKSREWWCVVYPESAPSNWRELVQETFLEAFISPLHDKDLNADGTPKKAHYHVVLAWPGPTTFSNAKGIIEQFKGVIQPKKIGTLRGVCRYLCHLDNPEKAQYDPNDVVCYNGADWHTIINLQSDKYIAIEEMQEFCSRYRITSFMQLNTYARNHRRADWFRTLCDNGSYIMREYCKSLQWEIDNFGSPLSIEMIDKMIAAQDEGKFVDLVIDPMTHHQRYEIVDVE